MAMEIGTGQCLAKLRWRLTGDPEEMICTLGLEPHNPDAFEVLDDVARRTYRAWAGAWEQDMLSSKWALVGCDIYGGPNNGDAQGTYNELLGGNSAAAPLPNNCCMLVKKKTASAGRKNAGRMYLPSGYLFDEQVSETGMIAPAELQSRQDNMQNFYESLQDDTQLGEGWAFADVGADPVLFHNDNSVATAITSFVVDALIATQRNRMRH